MGAPELIQVRQAALLLHGLPRAVRQQVLAKLDAAEVERLQPLLAELTELGVSQQLGQQLQHLASPPLLPTARQLTLLEKTEQLNAEDVVRCLQPCEPATVAALFRARNWPWREQALGIMSESRRTAVLASMRRTEPPMLAPAVLAFLHERLCLQAARSENGSPAEAAPGRSFAASARQPAARSQVRAHLGRLMAWIR
jgi:hypothetical protein